MVGVRVLKEVKDPAAHRADLVGAGLLSVAVASLAAAIVKGSDWGWVSAPILGALGVAVVSTVWFVLRSRHHPNPIIEPAVIRHRAVALADASSLVFFAGFGALVLGSVLFLTGVWHESVLKAGFKIAPGPLLAGLCAFPGGLLGSRFGHRSVGTVGMLLFMASGVWWVSQIGASPDYLGRVPPRQPSSAASGWAWCSPHWVVPPPRRCHRSASPPALRSTPCAGRSAWPSAWPAWWHCWERPPAPAR